MVTVRHIEKSIKDDKAVLTARVDCKILGLDGFELWYRFPKEVYPHIRISANPFVPALVLPSMYAGENLRIEGVVSQKLLEGAARVIEIYRMWHDDLKRIKIEAEDATKIIMPGPNTASFFSGGVDSFYTLLKNKNSQHADSERISHLIFVHGFDISLEETELFGSILTRIENVCNSHGKKLLVVATNVRRLIEDVCVWSMYHGSAMAGVALCLENFAGKVYIPADRSFRHIMPHGSHPLTDPLWSSESVEIVFDGAEVSRIEKIKLQLANDPAAMSNLRVCFENRDGKYNCGECEKCIRTKLNLKAAGGLEICGTLDNNIDCKRIKNLKMDECSRTYMVDNYQALQRAAADRKLLRAVKYCLSPWSVSERKKRIRKAEKAVKKKIREFLHINKPERKKIICRWSV